MVVWTKQSQTWFQRKAEDPDGMNKRKVMQEPHCVQLGVAGHHVRVQRQLRKHCSLSKLRTAVLNSDNELCSLQTGKRAVWEVIFWKQKTSSKSKRSPFIHQSQWGFSSSNFVKVMSRFRNIPFRIQKVVDLNNMIENKWSWSSDLCLKINLKAFCEKFLFWNRSLNRRKRWLLIFKKLINLTEKVNYNLFDLFVLTRVVVCYINISQHIK